MGLVRRSWGGFAVFAGGAVHPAAEGSGKTGGVCVAEVDGEFVQFHGAVLEQLQRQLAAFFFQQLAKLVPSWSSLRRRLRGDMARDLATSSSDATSPSGPSNCCRTCPAKPPDCRRSSC